MVTNSRSGKNVRLSNTHNLFGQQRETLDEAYAGDIISCITNADLRIGDTLSTKKGLTFNEIPRFAPECFAYLINHSSSSQKAFRKGLDHLLAEDIVQPFRLAGEYSPIPLLGAVGTLQFDVLQYRMKNEYGVETTLDIKPWTALRWVDPSVSEETVKRAVSYDSTYGEDDCGRMVILFRNNWSLQYFSEKNNEIILHSSPATLPE